MEIVARQLSYAFVRPFRIASQTYEDAPVIEVSIHDGGLTGRGEAAGVDYLGETCESMLAQVALISARMKGDAPLDSAWLQLALPAGGARNALDCALWDLTAKRTGVRAWERAGQLPGEIVTTITIGLDQPDVMARDAQSLGENARIKIKLGHADDRACLRAVREAAPDAELIVDVNEGWTYERLLAMEDELLANRVRLVEQPLPAADDERLREYRGSLALCADESCHDRDSLPSLIGKYDLVNIKLDKTGGLTEALALADAASAHGLRLMVGCMGGSSLGITPALIVAQRCEVVDLDCPLQLRRDIDHGLRYRGHVIGWPSPTLWG